MMKNNPLLMLVEVNKEAVFVPNGAFVLKFKPSVFISTTMSNRLFFIFLSIFHSQLML